MPGYPNCCPKPLPLCTICSADADTITVTFDRITDYSTCVNCNETFNTTFILNRVAGAPCRWSSSGSWECSTGDSKSYMVLAKILSGMPGVLWEVLLGFNWGGSPAQTDYYRASFTTTDYDCTATMNAGIYSRDVKSFCNSLASTSCQIN